MRYGTLIQSFGKDFMHFAHGIQIKKQFGQHFLRWQSIIDHMINEVTLDKDTSVFEIGCGDGFLTRSILKQQIKQLWVFEIDPQWADFVRKSMPNKRMTIYEQNILDLDWSIFEPDQPWTLLANLPYQITFPILHILHKHRHLLREGVIMVQEEVAEKILKTHGRGYGYSSLFFQYYFNWKKLEKVPPQAFEPPPKVDSRLLYFKPKENVKSIPNEDAFWDFIKLCFRQPRRTLKNNLQQTHFDSSLISDEILSLRAQQMKIDDFFQIWQKINNVDS